MVGVQIRAKKSGVGFFKCSMLITEYLSSSTDPIELVFVEREARPEFLMELSIQLHLSVLSSFRTVSNIYIFGVQRAQSIVHNRVHKTDLQPVIDNNQSRYSR